MAVKTRDSNIELLRILTICGVVVLHYNGSVAFNWITPNTLNMYVLYAFEVMFICAVNLFVLISGYFLSSTGQRKIIKALELVVQVVILGGLKYVAMGLLSGQGMSLRSLIAAMIPNNYFVTLYLTVYLLSPYINVLLDSLTEKQFGLLLGLSFCLFSVWPTVLDVFHELSGIHFTGMYTTNTGGSQFGYSVTNFMLMYMIGAYLRRYDIGRKMKTCGVLIAWTVCVAVLFVWQLGFAQTARAYSNPFVIASGVITFLLFKRFQFRSPLVNALAKGVFTCFLLHDLFLWFIGIEKVVNGNLLILLGHMTASVAGIFLVCWCVWWGYSKATGPVLRWLGEKLAPLDKLISIEK